MKEIAKEKEKENEIAKREEKRWNENVLFNCISHAYSFSNYPAQLKKFGLFKNWQEEEC